MSQFFGVREFSHTNSNRVGSVLTSCAVNIESEVSARRSRIYSAVTTKNSCTPCALNDCAHCQSSVACAWRSINYIIGQINHSLLKTNFAVKAVNVIKLVIHKLGVYVREPLPPPYAL